MMFRRVDFPDPRGAHDEDELTLLNGDIDTVKRHHVARREGINLGDVLETYDRHRRYVRFQEW
jgi:hypothetical protein